MALPMAPAQAASHCLEANVMVAASARLDALSPSRLPLQRPRRGSPGSPRAGIAHAKAIEPHRYRGRSRLLTARSSTSSATCSRRTPARPPSWGRRGVAGGRLSCIGRSREGGGDVGRMRMQTIRRSPEIVRAGTQLGGRSGTYLGRAMRAAADRSGSSVTLIVADPGQGRCAGSPS